MMKTATYVHIELPAGLALESRTALAELVVRLAARFSFLGMEDWAVDVPRSRVLGAEREFLDLRMAGKVKPEMRVYFGRPRDAAIFASALRGAFADLCVHPPRRLGARDWMKEWRRHYRTQVLREGSRTLAIVPAWKKCPQRGLAVRIAPGQAFGTGTHATTQLCLRLFLRHATKPGQGRGPALRVLDFGAGTGVLALAAEKWASSARVTFRALAVESDPVALEQCRKNLRLNRSRMIRCARRVGPARASDLVFANVLAPVLLECRGLLLGSVAPEGQLILSGVLAAEAGGFLRKFRAPGFRLVEKAEQGEWCAILLQRV